MLERGSGRSYRQIADGLNEDEVPTQNGKVWYASTVKNIMDALIRGEEPNEEA